jgi:N utilization substance protein B
MGYRRKSRELAMQALFFMDSGLYDSEEVIKLFCNNFKPSENVQSFFDIIVEGVLKYKNDIDVIIASNSKKWKLSRMSSVDRNILRIAVFELLYCKDIPAKVTINEAIDIGKRFGTVESGAFINGILDSINLIQSDIET